MKFYIAARFAHKEEVRRLHKIVRARGHEIVCDWTMYLPIKPYGENPDKAERYSLEDLEGVRGCEVFVLIDDKEGTGMHSELGAAIILGKIVYVIGENNERSMFYFHPAVKRRSSIEEVLDECEDLGKGGVL